MVLPCIIVMIFYGSLHMFGWCCSLYAGRQLVRWFVLYQYYKHLAYLTLDRLAHVTYRVRTIHVFFGDCSQSWLFFHTTFFAELAVRDKESSFPPISHHFPQLCRVTYIPGLYDGSYS